MDLAIRQLQISDFDNWRKLYYAYLAFYESQPVEAGTALLWERLLSSPPQIGSAVAVVGEEVIGFVHYHFQISTWTHSWHCYLEDLYVDEAYRGRGAASALIQEVKRAAVDAKCSELFWITRAGNETARALYDKVAKASDFVRYEILLEE